MMKYINCPNCGSRLLEGDDGSHIVLKCCKCSKLFEVTVNMAGVSVIPKTGANEHKSTKTLSVT